MENYGNFIKEWSKITFPHEKPLGKVVIKRIYLNFERNDLISEKRHIYFGHCFLVKIGP